MIRPTVARVDLGAIDDNLRAIADSRPASNPDLRLRPPTRPTAIPPRPAIIAVVKANAYGHGAAPVGLALERAGAAMLACADIEEGIVLRRAGVTLPILVFGALGISDLDGVFEHGLTPTISTPSAARSLQAAAARRAAVLRCHLKIDTGMNRLGFRHDNLRADAAGTGRERESRHRRRLHPLRDRGRPRESRVRAAARTLRTGGRPCSSRWGSARARAMPRTARRSCATSASGTTSSGPDSCSTASSRRRSPQPCRCDLPCHSIAVSCT